MNNGGPAFPVANIKDPNMADGMFLRDYFAGQALVGLMSAHSAEGDWTVDGCEDSAARIAYMAADAMLRARAKGENNG